MKRILLCSALVSAIGLAMPAAAQSTERTLPTAVTARPGIDTSAIAQRLRDRGLSDSAIDANMARIRAAIASGKYPHLARRIYNATHPDAGEDANRRRFLNATPDIDREVDREIDREIDRTGDRTRDVNRRTGR